MNDKSNVDFVHYIQKLYTSGRLIQEKDWKNLKELARTLDNITKRSNLLNKQAPIERFLGADVEEFIVLTQSYSKLLKVVLDMEEFIKHKDSESESFFESNEEALECIDKVFLDIEKLKLDKEEYLTKTFD